MGLSPPMNDIGTAMRYLKKAVDPSSINTIKDELRDCGYLKGDKIFETTRGHSRWSVARPGHLTGSMLPNYYLVRERREDHSTTIYDHDNRLGEA